MHIGRIVKFICTNLLQVAATSRAFTIRPTVTQADYFVSSSGKGLFCLQA